MGDSVGPVIVFGACVPDSGAAFREIAQPWLDRLTGESDLVLLETDEGGICAAYNRILDRVSTLGADLEGVVLLHDDVQVIDPRARELLRAALAQPAAGLVGVTGARGVLGARWWEGHRLVGGVYEPRGVLPARPRVWSGEVDVLDGMLLGLSPAAAARLRFDATTFPGFHGYDADICAQARAAGLDVEVIALEVFHRSTGQLGDQSAFHAAHSALAAKWPDLLGHRSRVDRVVRGAAERAGRLGQQILRFGSDRLRNHPRSDHEPPFVHEIHLDRSGHALRTAATETPDVVVWLNPAPDPRSSLTHLERSARAGGLTIESVAFDAPPVSAIPPAVAMLRAQHLLRGGDWPIVDRARLTLRGPQASGRHTSVLSRMP